MHRYIYWLQNWRANLRYLLYGNRITMQGALSATLIRANGSRKDLGVISKRVVTTAGVNFMRDDFNAAAGAADITNMKFHDSGTGVVAEAVGDVDLGTPAGPTTRATGSQSGAVAKQYVTVGTITYTATLAITEHGIFNQAARGAGSVLWDRSVFAAINVVATDAIQFTYTLTINDGG